MLIVNKQNVKSIYNDVNMNIYYHDKDLPKGQYNLVEGFSLQEIQEGMNNKVKYIAEDGKPKSFINL